MELGIIKFFCKEPAEHEDQITLINLAVEKKVPELPKVDSVGNPPSLGIPVSFLESRERESTGGFKFEVQKSRQLREKLSLITCRGFFFLDRSVLLICCLFWLVVEHVKTISREAACRILAKLGKSSTLTIVV